MSKYIIAIAALALLCSPAFATTWEGDGAVDIVVTLDIGGYVQFVEKNSTVEFGSPDYYNDDMVEGAAYTVTPGAEFWQQDPSGAWAGDYASGSNPDGTWFESEDSARIGVKGNVNLDMIIDDQGPLKDGSNTIPTWFTVSAFGDVTQDSVGPGALIAGQIYESSANAGLPGVVAGTAGRFFYDSGSRVLVLDLTGTANEFPNQDALPLNSGVDYTADLDASVDCTLTFVSRIHRTGMAQPAGNYSTTIGVLIKE